MRSLIAAGVLILAAGCGGSGDGSSARIVDRAAWKAELIALDDVGPSPDLDKLEALTRDDCDSDVADLALQFSLEGARPDVSRVNMKYICPDSAHKVDDALKHLQDASADVDLACETDPSLRTEEQTMLAEAIGCD